jgi:hypothetical protein
MKGLLNAIRWYGLVGDGRSSKLAVSWCWHIKIHIRTSAKLSGLSLFPRLGAP